jgi:hypothetical protein
MEQNTLGFFTALSFWIVVIFGVLIVILDAHRSHISAKKEEAWKQSALKGVRQSRRST